MSIATVTAARILDGQNRGLSGEENFLSFGQFPFLGLVKTYNVDAQTPDSAGTMTAIMSGIKTDFGVVGVDEKVTRGDCESQSGNEVISALELAEIAGLSTGIVSTARITHATPAAGRALGDTCRFGKTSPCLRPLSSRPRTVIVPLACHFGRRARPRGHLPLWQGVARHQPLYSPLGTATRPSQATAAAG